MSDKGTEPDYRNPPAFPTKDMDFEGMSLRDWFAATAQYSDEDRVSGLPHVQFDKVFGETPPVDQPTEWLRYWARVEAEIRYIKANAMLEARNK